MILGPLGTRPLLVLLGTPVEILDDGVLYMNILLWGILGIFKLERNRIECTRVRTNGWYWFELITDDSDSKGEN